MNTLFNDDFILTNDVASDIFHSSCENEPIIDYHCHLIPAEMVANENYANITEIWLGADHYKWRLLRANGVPEELVTGNGDDYEKFLAFAATLEKAAGNPIYEWSHLELRRFWGITEELNTESAPRIWEQANKLLATDAFKPRNLIADKNVKLVCTTDDPIDNLADHATLAEIETRFQVLPGFRPDRAWEIDKPDYTEYIAKLADVSGVEINSYQSLINALEKRFVYFKERGCVVTDHGFTALPYVEGGYNAESADKVLKKALSGAKTNADDFNTLLFHTLVDLMAIYKKYDIITQFHFGVTRSINAPKLAETGINTGFDAIADTPNVAVGIKQLLNTALERSGLPTCIWYSLNPNDWMSILTIMGGFQDGVGYQSQHFGSGWWFNDTYSGMKSQIEKLAEEGLLGNFLGMLTDSRSLVSWPRHEYFRRILCDHLGELVTQGRLTLSAAHRTAKDVAYGNVRALLEK